MKKKAFEKSRKPGRPTVPENLKRVRMTGIRIQKWLYEWLMSQPGSKGQMIEQMLIAKYDIDEKPVSLTSNVK